MTAPPHEYFPSRTGDEIIDIYKAAVVPGTDEKYAARLTDAAGEYKAEVRVATEFCERPSATWTHSSALTCTRWMRT
ncbi:MAG: hypothetical protein ACLSB9_14755 [Hydrogeniiclostridium mannosilyticum]